MKRALASLCVVAALAFASPAAAAYAKTACFSTTPGTPATLTIASQLTGWNNLDNRISAWSAAGDGSVGTSGVGFGGGGSGAFNFLVNATLSSTNTYQVGLHGGGVSTTAADILCNGIANCGSISGTAVILAIRGGTTSTNAGTSAGATTTSAVPLANATAGAAGGAGGTAKGGGGGGAPPGPGGAGGVGASGVTTGSHFGAGGTGDNATGGAGGASAAAAGAAGTEAFSCDATLGDVHGAIGSGGGGAGGDTTGSVSGGNGAAFGAGGGGAFFGGSAGTGGNGVLVFQWNPVSTSNHNNLLLLGVGQ